MPFVAFFRSDRVRRKSHSPMVAHNCHGKTKNLTEKTKTSRQNQKPHGKNKIPHSKSKIALFCRGYLLLLWSIWFCREVFGFVVRYFVFAVRFLVLPWGFCFCREVFGFAVRYFVFALRFLVLPWLWATVGPQIFESELFFSQTQCLQCGDTMSLG